MSTQVLSEVLEHSAACDAALLVIIILGDQAARETREAHVSNALIMRLTKKSERTVRYALRELERLGEITTVARATGRNDFNVYRVNKLPVQKGAIVAPFTDSEGGNGLPPDKAERGQLATEKGAICDRGRGQSATASNSVNYSGLSQHLNTLSSSASRSSTARMILAELNRRADREFKPVPANLEPIEARLREGFTLEDFHRVMSRKILKWSKSDKADYIRPATFFSAKNFANYAGEKGDICRDDGRKPLDVFGRERLALITAPLPGMQLSLP